MTTPEQALAQRIKDLRRRHFGLRGPEQLAQKLGISTDEYLRYERGVVPPGEIMVRLCEVTGEDLQWLLTGVAGRGAVVITGTRARHQELLARLARLLDERPEFAAPLEAFVNLLACGPRERAEMAALPGPDPAHLIPILELEELPATLPEGPPRGFDLARFADPSGPVQRDPARLAEPAMQYDPQAARAAEILTLVQEGGRRRRCVHSAEVTRVFPEAFGVAVTDDLMQPMFTEGDAILVAPGVEPKVGQPALCRLAVEPALRCRIWLGADDGTIHLGRLADGETERVPRDQVLWSAEVLFRVARAA